VVQLVDVEEPIRREGIKITHGTTTHLIATGTRDIVIDGETYIAGPSGRDKVEIRTLGDDHAMELVLPVSHPFVQRYTAINVPPREITVEVRSAYESTFDLMHVGFVVVDVRRWTRRTILRAVADRRCGAPPAARALRRSAVRPRALQRQLPRRSRDVHGLGH
jgi:hypothetical protein